MYGSNQEDDNNNSNADYQKYQEQDQEEEEYQPQSTNQTLGQHFNNDQNDEQQQYNQSLISDQQNSFNNNTQNNNNDDYEQTPQPQKAGGGSSNYGYHLDLSQVQTDMLIFLSPENFSIQLSEDIKKCNTGVTDLDISQNTRVQEVKTIQYYLRMLNLIILAGSFLFWLITCIIYSQMFKQPVQGFAQFLFITAQIVWALEIGAIGFTSKIFNINYMKILFLVQAGIFLFVFIGFCIAASRVSGGYVFYLLLQLAALGGKQFGLFNMVKKMEGLKERLQ